MFNYKKYFEKITPVSKQDVYNRFLFALCSVHVTWENNIKGYQYLKDKAFDSKLDTLIYVIESKLGMNKVRTKAFMNLWKIFDEDWTQVKKNDKETWQDYATKLEGLFFGLGYAKSRFAIEMCYPNKAQIVCTDTHILQWAKQKSGKVSRKTCNKVEQGFLNHALQHGIPPVEMRWKMWDKIQGYNNPRYWSKVLE